MSQGRLVSTPLEVRNASSCTSKAKSQRHMLDGLLAIGKEFSILDPLQYFIINQKLSIKAKSATHFKGVTVLNCYPSIFEISLGYTVFGNTVSLLLVDLKTEIQPTESETQHTYKYEVVLAAVHKCVNESIIQLGFLSRSNSSYLLTCGETRKVYPEDVANFSHNLSTKLNDAGFKFYFTIRRMGQDIEIKSTSELLQLSKSYLEINTNNIISLTFHFAIDTIPVENEVFLWKLDEISTRLGKPHGVFHILFLPNFGNITYNWGQEENQLPVKFLHLYLRCGHQIHREKEQFFSDPRITKRLTELQGMMQKQSKEDITFSRCDTLILSGKVSNWVNELETQISFHPPLRCEVVYEVRRIGSSANLSTGHNPVGLSLSYMMEIAYEGSVDYINVFNLLHHENFVKISAATLKQWIHSTLVPCSKLLMDYTNFVNTRLETNRNVKNIVSRVSLTHGEDICKQYVDAGHSLLELVMDVLIAECILSYFFRGNLSKAWPQYLHRFLGFLDIETNGPGAGSLKNIKFFNGRIKCELDSNLVATLIPMWLGHLSGQKYEELLVFQQHLVGRGSRLNDADLENTFNSIAICVCEILQQIAVHNRAPIDVSPDPSISLDLEYIKKYSAPFIKAAVVLTPSELIAEILKGKNVLPETVVLLLQALTKSAKIKGKKEAFLKYISEEIKLQMVDQKSTFLFPLNQYKLAAVVPDGDYEESFVPIYEQAFFAVYEKKYGPFNNTSEEIFEKCLPRFCSDEIMRRFLPQTIVNVVHEFMMSRDLQSIIQKCFSLPIGEDIKSFLENVLFK